MLTRPLHIVAVGIVTIGLLITIFLTNKDLTSSAAHAATISGTGTNSAVAGVYNIGGLIQKGDSSAGLPGVTVTISARKSDGTVTDTNVVTDAQGYFYIPVDLVVDESYAVRPQGIGPAGYATPPRTSNNSYSYAANLAKNTPIGSPSYEQQVVGQSDCASMPSWPRGACNFVYNPSAQAVVNPLPGVGTGPHESPIGPAVSTGTGGSGYVSFVRYVNDCSNGFAASAVYSPTTPSDLTQPAYYYNLESVTDANQAGLGKGHLLGQARLLNGATFTDVHPAWAAANGGTILFYIYTAQENTDPTLSYTIHGLDAAGHEVSAGPTDPAPLPYLLSCPIGSIPPPIPGQQNPGGGNPPVNTGGGTGAGSLVKKSMNITMRVDLTQQIGGGTSATPRVTSIPVAVKIVNGAQPGDSSLHSMLVTYVSPGVWEGTILTSHFTGGQFAFVVWPFNGPSKSICSMGPNSPHVLYPATYQCRESEGSIALVEGANTIDLTGIPLGVGDVAVSGLHDGHIDTQDLYYIQQKMGNTDPASLQAADMNFDGQINIDDYNLATWSLEHVSN